MLFFDFIHVSVHGGSWQRGKFYWGYLIYNVLIKKVKGGFLSIDVMTKPSNHKNRSNKGKYQNVPVILRRSIWNFNIPPPGQPQGPWTLNFEDWFVQIPNPGTKIVFKCLTHIFFKGKISDRNFLHIDQALKPRRCRPFLLNHLPARVNYLP